MKEELQKELRNLEKREEKLVNNLKNKELNLIELRKTVENMRNEKIQLKKAKLEKLEGMKIKVAANDAEELKNLESRHSSLKDRKEEIEKAVGLIKSKKQFSNQIKNNFVLKEKLQDYLYENDVLERYLRSESFRSLDEAFIGYKHLIEELKNEKDSLNNVLRAYEKEEK